MTKQDEQVTAETNILKNWHVKMLVLIAIVTPTITATGAYYGVREKAATDKAEVSERVNKLELSIERTFADKASMQLLDERTRRMESDITEIKTILKTKLR